MWVACTACPRKVGSSLWHCTLMTSVGTVAGWCTAAWTRHLAVVQTVRHRSVLANEARLRFVHDLIMLPPQRGQNRAQGRVNITRGVTSLTC